MVLEELENHPDIKIVEPNYIYSLAKTPDDFYFKQLWGMHNSSRGFDINAKKAWDITTGSKDIVVAVIDTGIAYDHPDLKNNMWVNQAEKDGKPGVDDDENGYVDDIYGYDFVNKDGDPMDDQGHGTHCAGTIGAEGNNEFGVAGVNWNVSLMAIKFLSNRGKGTTEDSILAVDYATMMNVDVMSNSWGGSEKSQLLYEAIERSQEAGIVFVAAAGNSRNNSDVKPLFPAAYDVENIISVASIDSNGRLSRFSNYGPITVDIAAPGSRILSTARFDRFANLSGTSMAAPNVSGVAALIKAHDPELTEPQIRKKILRSVRGISTVENKVSTSGILDAYAALMLEVPAETEEEEKEEQE